MLTFPKRIAQGVTVKVEDIALSDYPASAGWSLKYVFVTSADQLEVDAVADGDNFDLTVTKVETAALTIGTYFWQAFVDDGTDRYMVGEGETLVVADFLTQTTGYDARSTLRQQLEAMRAVIAGKATSEQKRVKYSDREIQHYEIAELIAIVRYLEAEVKREQQEADIANDKAFGGRVRVRF